MVNIFIFFNVATFRRQIFYLLLFRYQYGMVKPHYNVIIFSPYLISICGPRWYGKYISCLLMSSGIKVPSSKRRLPSCKHQSLSTTKIWTPNTCLCNFLYFPVSAMIKLRDHLPCILLWPGNTTCPCLKLLPRIIVSFNEDIQYFILQSIFLVPWETENLL